MTYGLLVQAERIAQKATRRRLHEIASAAETMGLVAETAEDSVTVKGRRIMKRWIADPLLRFAGRIAA